MSNNGREVTINIDDLIDRAMQVSTEWPNMKEMIEAAGSFAVPAVAEKYVPLLGVGAQLLRKFMPRKSADGLTLAGMPDTGPLGRGRMSYLLQRSKWSDEQVVAAINMVTHPDFPSSSTILANIKYTMAVMYPGNVGEFTDAQTRAAIDQILEKDGMSQNVCDKMGDLLNYALNTGMVKGK